MTDDLDDASVPTLLRTIVLELRALRRVVGLAFVVGVTLVIGLPLLLRLGG